MVDPKYQEMKQVWEERSEEMGNTARAVLFKRFPGFVNSWIHRQHVSFILSQLPPETSNLLDVGCGYGRLSRIVQEHRPTISFEGVDLCQKFAQEYERNIGPCFCGPVQAFKPEKTFDAILVVTLLMYLGIEEQKDLIDRLMQFLRPSGRLICIEPALEFQTAFRKIFRRKSLSPTGGNVHYFHARELEDLLTRSHNISVIGHCRISALPWTSRIPVHHCIAITRT